MDEDLAAFAARFQAVLQSGDVPKIAECFHPQASVVFSAKGGATVGDLQTFFHEALRTGAPRPGDLTFTLVDLEDEGEWGRVRSVMTSVDVPEDIHCAYVAAKTAEGWRIVNKVVVHR